MHTGTVTTRSSSADAVERLLAPGVGRLELRADPFTYEAEISQDERFSLARIRLGGDISCLAEVRTIAVASAAGAVSWQSGEWSGDLADAPALIEPERLWTATMADVDLRVASIDAAALESVARAMYGDDRLTVAFDHPMPLSREHARKVTGSLALATAMLTPDLLRADLLRASVFHFLSVSILEAFPLLGDRVTRSMNSATLLTGFRRAQAFIDDHASLPITVDDIANAAGLTTAQLDHAFLAHSRSGGSAVAALRAARLSAAHRDLIEGDPTLGDTVGAIALRWGFTPAGFARIHRSEYGSSPRWVLDR